MGALTKEQILDDEGLATLLCEVESIVNGRPVTKVSDNRRDTKSSAVTSLRAFGTTWSLLQR